MTQGNSNADNEPVKPARNISMAVTALIIFFTVVLTLKIALQIFSAQDIKSENTGRDGNIPVKVSGIPGFYCPIRMEMGRNEEVKFIVSPKQFRGHKVRSIKAQLKSRDKGIFTITSLSPEEKTPASASSSGWRWKVVPEKWGEQELILKLEISLESGGKLKILERSWNRRIEVDYNRNYWLYRWRWVLVGCGILIAAVLADILLRNRAKAERG